MCPSSASYQVLDLFMIKTDYNHKQKTFFGYMLYQLIGL